MNRKKDHIFTRSFPQREPTPWTCVLYSFHPSQDPSVSIESQPKINHIDYISFVLGVIGSWLGISVLSFNPIPKVFQMIQGQKNNSITGYQHKSEDEVLILKQNMMYIASLHRKTNTELGILKSVFNRVMNKN